jgi:hypothetical protein
MLTSEDHRRLTGRCIRLAKPKFKDVAAVTHYRHLFCAALSLDFTLQLPGSHTRTICSARTERASIRPRQWSKGLASRTRPIQRCSRIQRPPQGLRVSSEKCAQGARFSARSFIKQVAPSHSLQRPPLSSSSRCALASLPKHMRRG